MQKTMKIETKVLIEAILVASIEREKRVYPNYLFLLEKQPGLQGWAMNNRLVVSASSIKEASAIAYNTPFYENGTKDEEWLDENTYNCEDLGLTQKSEGVIMTDGAD